VCPPDAYKNVGRILLKITIAITITNKKHTTITGITVTGITVVNGK
jgi:hypothetical protein